MEAVMVARNKEQTETSIPHNFRLRVRREWHPEFWIEVVMTTNGIQVHGADELVVFPLVSNVIEVQLVDKPES